MPASVRQALLGLRYLAAGTMFIHGTYRLYDGGVSGFGGFLAASHVPAGAIVAWIITIMEATGSVALVLGFAVRPLALYFAAELSMGILLVHAPNGWFVVGGGRNGVEYSVVLVGLFLAQAWAAPELQPSKTVGAPLVGAHGDPGRPQGPPRQIH